jgi:hypothetical protein
VPAPAERQLPPRPEPFLSHRNVARKRANRGTAVNDVKGLPEAALST